MGIPQSAVDMEGEELTRGRVPVSKLVCFVPGVDDEWAREVVRSWHAS